jgi:23S rRNA pseudouridine1911/1915/1917 synthase
MQRLSLVADASAAGERVDRWLAARIAGVSRARLQVLIASGHVLIDGGAPKRAHRLVPGERIEIEIPPPPPQELEPEPMPLSVVYEDEHVLVLDKPAGIVVHPGAGRTRGTLAAAVLSHAPGTAGVGGARRPGVVHRLDKDTSGLIVMAKTPQAYESLTAQLVSRTVRRVYLAVVHGRLAPTEGVVDQPIGRDPRHRTRMAVRPPGQGRRAVTRYRVLERLAGFTVVEARLQTGRTHQIRVHLADLGHPIAGDDLYGARRRRELPVAIEGLALHAMALGFEHPATRRPLNFTSPVPPRIERFLSHLRDGH